MCLELDGVSPVWSTMKVSIQIVIAKCSSALSCGPDDVVDVYGYLGNGYDYKEAEHDFSDGRRVYHKKQHNVPRAEWAQSEWVPRTILLLDLDMIQSSMTIITE